MQLTLSSCINGVRRPPDIRQETKEKKQREREERKQRKIDHYFKKIKKEKDVNENVVHYDGDDEEDGRNVLIVNPVQFGNFKPISTASNEAPGKFKRNFKRSVSNAANFIKCAYK